jgi:hypothetical protein
VFSCISQNCALAMSIRVLRSQTLASSAGSTTQRAPSSFPRHPSSSHTFAQTLPNTHLHSTQQVIAADLMSIAMELRKTIYEMVFRRRQSTPRLQQTNLQRSDRHTLQQKHLSHHATHQVTTQMGWVVPVAAISSPCPAWQRVLRHH